MYHNDPEDEEGEKFTHKTKLFHCWMILLTSYLLSLKSHIHRNASAIVHGPHLYDMYVTSRCTSCQNGDTLYYIGKGAHALHVFGN